MHGSRLATTTFAVPAFLFLLASLPLTLAVNLSACNAHVANLLNNHTLSPDSSAFYRDAFGRPYSNPSDLILTLAGCQNTCGRHWTPYSPQQIAQRLTTWLVPILSLVGNMHWAKLGGLCTPLSIIRLLGDPINSIWSLLTMLEAARRNHAWAHQHATRRSVPIADVAAIITALEELDDGSGTGTLPRQHLLSYITSPSSFSSSGVPTSFDTAASDAAISLLDARVDESTRSYLAILSFLVAVGSAFIDAADGTNTAQPGNRIAFAMLYSWLVPTVLLSATLGRYASRRSCRRVIDQFRASVAGPEQPASEWYQRTRRSTLFGRWSARWRVEQSFHDAQSWTGAIYVYRPRKTLAPSGTRGDRPAWLLYALALSPILLATFCAFTISWMTPTTGLGCRSLSQVTICGLWILSSFLTQLFASSPRLATGKYLYYLIHVKDALIGVPAVFSVLLANIGIYNSCWCWSAVYSRGRHGANVLLDPEGARRKQAETVYPALAFGCLLVQFVLVAVMLWMMGKESKEAFRRTEEERHAEWQVLRGEDAKDKKAGAEARDGSTELVQWGDNGSREAVQWEDTRDEARLLPSPRQAV